MQDQLAEMIRMQRKLQEIYGYRFGEMSEDERLAYIKTMYIGAIKELGEALDETPWKFWGKPFHTDARALTGELSDAFQFIINMWLAVLPDATSDDIAATMRDVMVKKIEINVQRHRAGYDVRNTKCMHCGRALDDPAVSCRRTADQGYCAVENVDYNIIRDTVTP